MEKRMKGALASVLTLTVAAVMLAGCASAPGAAKAEDKVIRLEDKGTALDIATPKWVAVGVGQSVSALEKESDFKGNYCILANETSVGDNQLVLQQLMTWVNNFNAQQQLGATISTRVASVFKAVENKLPENEESRRKFSNSINTLISASYSGARKEGDWWIKQRVESKDGSSVVRYTAYVLYTIPKDVLNEQIAAQVTKAKKDNPGLDAAFDAVTATILEKGLEWDAD
jgi:hypothetical protein